MLKVDSISLSDSASTLSPSFKPTGPKSKLMSASIVPGKGPEESVVLIDNGEASQFKVSLQTVQGIYNEITGKTEQLSRGFEVPFQLILGDLEQLHLKMSQLCEQYNICSSNHSVTIYHSEDNKEQFSSFERFRLYNKSSTNAVESVIMKYNFLIILPHVNKPQSYTITVRLASRIAIFKKLAQDVPLSMSVFRVMGSRTAMITVDYVDYLVARNFADTFEGWIKTLSKHDLPAWASFLQRNSHHAPSFLRYGMLLTLGVIIAKRIPVWVPQNSTDLTNQSLVLFLAMLAVVFGAELGKSIGRFIERNLDDLSGVSYLNLNRGDEQLIGEATAHNRWAKFKVFAGLAGSLALGVISSVIANNL